MGKYTGSCLCGHIKYKVEGDFEAFMLCHCERCQKDTGSAHAANLFATNAKLTWLCGQEDVKTFNYQSDGHIKSFCPICGSALPNMQAGGTRLVVPAGSLDTDVPITPSAHIFYAHRANWDNDLEKVPKFEELP